MSLREIESKSIRSFVQQAADEGYLSGRVLDYGCGKQPYRDIVEAAGGEYFGFDLVRFPANLSGEDVGVYERTLSPFWTPARPPTLKHTSYDTILCTQVLQYVEDAADLLEDLRWQEDHARFKGQTTLVLTYPTNWPEVELEDLHRFTKAGMERLLTEAGFEILVHEPRATFRAWVNEWITDEFVVGYGVICRV